MAWNPPRAGSGRTSEVPVAQGRLCGSRGVTSRDASVSRLFDQGLPLAPLRLCAMQLGELDDGIVERRVCGMSRVSPRPTREERLAPGRGAASRRQGAKVRDQESTRSNRMAWNHPRAGGGRTSGLRNAQPRHFGGRGVTNRDVSAYRLFDEGRPLAPWRLCAMQLGKVDDRIVERRVCGMSRVSPRPTREERRAPGRGAASRRQGAKVRDQESTRSNRMAWNHPRAGGGRTSGLRNAQPRHFGGRGVTNRDVSAYRLFDEGRPLAPWRLCAIQLR